MNTAKNIFKCGAKVVDLLLNPLTAPLYFAAHIFFGDNFYNTQYLSLQFKLLLLLYIFLLTVLLPFVCSKLANRLFSSAVEPDDVNSRNIETLSVILSFGLSFFLLSDSLSSELAFRFFFYFGVVRLLEWIFSVFIPNLDSHTVISASLTTIVALLVMLGYNSSILSLVIFIALSALLITSRLLLGYTTLPFASWSFLLGVGAMLITISLY